MHGSGGRAKETQSEFLVLFEGAITTPDISKSIQCYQLAIDEAKVRLDFAVALGTWLVPSRMIINTESTMGYNNQLKQATQGMKLGVNNEFEFVDGVAIVLFYFFLTQPFERANCKSYHMHHTKILYLIDLELAI